MMLHLHPLEGKIWGGCKTFSNSTFLSEKMQVYVPCLERFAHLSCLISIFSG
ncbi:MAG: hypothetical protein ACTSQP_22635 [Promethearchaeota archaeon]